LLLDLDGTTVASREDALPSERVIKAVNQAQQHLTVALATGRPLQFAQPVIDALGLKGPGVFNGGAEVIDLTTGEALHRQLLPVETLRELVKIALPFGYDVSNDEDQYRLLITTPEQITKPATKILIKGVDKNTTINLLEELSAVMGAAAHPTSSWQAGDVLDIHITHEHATKRHGVEKLIDILSCKQEEVMAIGDSHNDVPLLEAAGLKIAMGNAPEEVKAIADHVVGSIENDGVAEAIERYILN